jgi:chaperonin GroES
MFRKAKCFAPFKLGIIGIKAAATKCSQVAAASCERYSLRGGKSHQGEHYKAMTTNIRPLHDRLIVKRIEVGEQVRGGIIIPDSAKEKPQEGEVLAVGLGKYREDGTRQTLDVKTGDHVLFGKYSSSEIKLDGVELLIMREDEILGIIERAGAAAGSAGSTFAVSGKKSRK